MADNAKQKLLADIQLLSGSITTQKDCMLRAAVAHDTVATKLYASQVVALETRVNALQQRLRVITTATNVADDAKTAVLTYKVISASAKEAHATKLPAVSLVDKKFDQLAEVRDSTRVVDEAFDINSYESCQSDADRVTELVDQANTTCEMDAKKELGTESAPTAKVGTPVTSPDTTVKVTSATTKQVVAHKITLFSDQDF